MMAVVLVMSVLSVSAQQLPNPGFENWGGAQFDGNIQLTSWQASNVEQVGFKFNFIDRQTGRSGYCAHIQNKEVGAMGVYQTSPGYFTLGTPWQYLPSITAINDATGGTDGGISFAYRPDSLYVWVKRTGSNPTGENYSILFYSWKGTSQGNKYKANKSNSCTSTSHSDEESDIRQALDANSCGTSVQATQVAEGFVFEKKEYTNWTQIKVPIYYFNDETPQKCNVIFSSSGYPNFRNSAGIVAGNDLYVDDVSLVYSATIQQLYIGGKQWKGFDPNSSDEQIYSVGHTTVVPEVYAVRGAGSITNIAGTKVNFPGRRLSGNEINIQYGTVDGAPTVITVTAADGSTTRTYRIKMIQAASENPQLSDIQVNGESVQGFNPAVGTYNVALPYGTTAAPVVTAVKAEDAQTVTVTQATSPTGTATINVVAADGTHTKTYTINFSVAPLADNTLQGIKVNGQPILDFDPAITTYRVELPLGTTTMPTVEAISAYPAGAQTIVYTAPATIDNGQYKISVTTPGNQTAKVYKLNFKITASTNSKLADLKMGNYITDFSPSKTTYYVTLPMGTTTLPAITYTKGDASQTVTVEEGGVDGTTRVTVTAASGDQTIYKIICSTEKSEASHLNMIFIGGEALAGFNPNTTNYTYDLPIGTTELPAITWTAADEFETVVLTTGGLNGVTRITVTAGNGNTTIYKITFSLETSSNATLNNIYIGGEALEGFDPNTYVYLITLPKGTTELPAITWEQHDEWQTVTMRAGGVNGDTKITVRPQTGASQTYTLQFRVQTSSVNHLNMIYLDGAPLANFHRDTLSYVDSLPVGVSAIPAITYDAPEDVKAVKVLSAGNIRTLRVMAEDGKTRDYVIQFVVTKLESAFPKMIYVNGDSLPGFNKNELSYIYEFEGDVAPTITVDKDGDQQVTILTPVREGTAQVIVKPQGSSEGNTYTIVFRLKTSEDVMLQNILFDGAPFADFRAEQLDYSVPYTDAIPDVTCVAAAGQTVTKLQEKNIVRFVVLSTAGNSAVYTLTFNKQFSSDSTLQAILLDGVAMTGFDPATFVYPIELPAGSVVPEITYTKAHAEQVVYMGQTGEKSYTITVIAEDGAMATYSLDFSIALFTSTELQSIELDGTPLELQSGVYTYNRSLYEGAALPELTFTKGAGQTALALNTSATQQQILVKAENGDVATYEINYTIIRSGDASLSDILLDGVSLTDFESTTLAYTHELPWRTKVVPVIQPISATPGQTITIDYGAINATTHIHVVAADGVAEKDYTIVFPVHQSDNTQLESVSFEDVDFDFRSDSNDYVITLPYQTKAVPAIMYDQQEPEQRVEFVSAPITDTTKLIVTAENGDKRTYTFAFNVPLSDKTNVLRSLIINTNKVADQERAVAEDETDITIDLAYGTTEFNVNYVKNFDEQTVLVQPGGIFRPTKITVKANRGDEADKVYTITPNIDRQNPAVLESLSVNGTPLEGFDKNRFSYIVSVTDQPDIEYTKAEGVHVEYPTKTVHKWTTTVSKDGYENTYTLFFYYKNDVIPNNDFTQWSKAVYNNADKPTGWWVPADKQEKVQVVSSTATGDEVIKKSDTAVGLETSYSSPAGGPLPAMLTLGDLNVAFTVAGKSTISFAGGIQFRNTPDNVSVKYYYQTKKSDGAFIAVRFYDYENKEYKDGDWIITSTNSNYTEYSKSIATDGKDIRKMNIAIGSNYDEGNFAENKIQNGAGGSGVKFYVDKIAFSYNNKLSKVFVNGAEATKGSGNMFTYTLPSSEMTDEPVLTFVGEVSDQAQKVTIGDESNGTRNATVYNYGEDGKYTQYMVQIKRPLSTINTLASLEVNGQTITGWSADKTDYTVTLPHGQSRLYDVRALHGSNLQTVTTTQSGNTVTIQVKPESGATKTYTVNFVEGKSADVTLASLIASGVEYDPTVTEYAVSAASLPSIRFVKQSDGQTVILRDGQLFITAEDGVSRDTITITNTPPALVTTAKLSDLSIDGNTIEGFSADQFAYSKKEPNTTSFVREFDSDVVRQLITPDSITWQVTGTSDVHTYSLVYPTDLSSEVAIDTIYINGRPLEDFNVAETEYTIHSNEPITLTIHPKAGQQVTATIQVTPIAPSSAAGRAHAPASRMGLRYVLSVVAEDGLAQQQYTIDVLPEVSSDATLQMIRLDGVDLTGFKADSAKYVITLPTTNPKIVEPRMPSITYVTNHFAQTVAVDTAHLGGTSYITVTSEDQSAINVYELTVKPEPSHNAELNGLLLDGQLIPNFSSDRHFYSALVDNMNVKVDYSSLDRFQHVDTIHNGNIITVRVTAQDSVTVNDYSIELYTRQLSADVSLANILLDHKSFTEYDPTLTPFSPMNNFYIIPIVGTHATPDVSAMLNSEGQSMQISEHADSVFITVTAEDGVHTNTYTLYFKHEYSSNTALAKLEVGDSLLALVPGQTQYVFTLNVGEKDARTVTYELADYDLQRAENEIAEGLNWSVDVIAENGTRVTYSVEFVITKSDNAFLSEITANDVEIEGFRADSFYYHLLLDKGVRTLPEISFYEGDAWQHAQVIDTIAAGLTTTYKCTVLAEDSIHRSIYTVVMDIQPSDVDTLASVTIGGQPFMAFDAHVSNYVYPLPKGTTQLPTVECEKGDAYQDTLSTVIGTVYSIIVTAENGQHRTYTITFNIARNNDATLRAIYYGTDSIANFDAETPDYTITLPYGTTALPLVTYVKNDVTQQTQMRVEDNSVLITVTAEDGTERTYTLTFVTAKSPESRLAAIIVGGEQLEAFEPENYEYTVTLPYGTTEMPKVEAVLSDTTASMEIADDAMTVTISTTSADEEHFSEYVVHFVTERCTIDWLLDLRVKDATIEGFDKDSLNYTITYPQGSDSTKFIHVSDITYAVADTTETVEVTEDNGEIQVLVTAQNNTFRRPYTIRQVILLSNNCLLRDLTLNGRTIKNFADSVFVYSYTLLDGEVAPEVEAVAQDSLSEVSVSYETDQVRVFCTAQDGTEAIYAIAFEISSLNTGQTPSSTDVLIKQIKGTDQFAAYSIRLNTYLAIYDDKGHMYYNIEVPACNPNDAVIAIDARGKEVLTDANGDAAYFSLPAHGQTMFYLFYSNNERIQSGKFMVK